MYPIETDALQCAPNTLSKVQLAQWIKSKCPALSWDEAHYHAMRVQMKKLDGYIENDFASVGIDCDLDMIAKLFHDSLSEKYEHAVEFIDVPRLRVEFIELLTSNLCMS